MARGDTGASGNWYNGLDEAQEMAFVGHCIRPGDCFIDVGANVGSYSVLAAARGAKVVAIEPAPTTYKKLLRNIDYNSYSSLVTALNVAVAEAPQTLRLTSDLGSTNHIVDDPARENGEFATLSILADTLDNIASGTSPTIMKIDIEGYELKALKGGSSIIRKDSLLAIIVETADFGNRYGDKRDELFAFLSRNGFSPFYYNPFTRALEESGRGTSPGNNTIFVRDRLAVQARCTSARPISLLNGQL